MMCSAPVIADARTAEADTDLGMLAQSEQLASTIRSPQHQQPLAPVGSPKSPLTAAVAIARVSRFHPPVNVGESVDIDWTAWA
jgi:hypothetical protein